MERLGGRGRAESADEPPFVAGAQQERELGERQVDCKQKAGASKAKAERVEELLCGAERKAYSSPTVEEHVGTCAGGQRGEERTDECAELER